MMDSVFNMAEYTVTLDKLGDTFEIIPIGDVHRDTPNCDMGRWRAFIKYAKKELKPTTVFIGTGDWNDFAAWGDRRKIKNSNLHESTIEALDQTALKHCNEMMDDLQFAKNNFAGVIQGNHRWDFTFGACANMSSDDYYAKQLNCTNMGDLGYLRIHVKYKRGGNRRHVVDVVLHHGKAGGKLAGSTINQVDDMRVVFPDADIYVMGHDHRKGAIPVTSLRVQSGSTGLILKQKRQWLARSGAFLRGYVPNSPNYIVSKMLRPTDLGIIKFVCGAKRDQSGGADKLTNDIHVWY